MLAKPEPVVSRESSGHRRVGPKKSAQRGGSVAPAVVHARAPRNSGCDARPPGFATRKLSGTHPCAPLVPALPEPHVALRLGKRGADNTNAPAVREHPGAGPGGIAPWPGPV